MKIHYYGITWQLEVVDFGMCKDFGEADDKARFHKGEFLYIATGSDLLDLSKNIQNAIL